MTNKARSSLRKILFDKAMNLLTRLDTYWGYSSAPYIDCKYINWRLIVPYIYIKEKTTYHY